MQVPILSRRREAQRLTIERRAAKLAIGAVEKSIAESGTVAKAFLSGNAALGSGSMGSSAATMLSAAASRATQGGPNQTSDSLIARVTQNLASGFERAPEELELALAAQGMSYGPPFPPGRPIDPFWGYRRPPRTFDYSVGENVRLTPRWNRTSFPTIRAIYESYDVAQICVRHLINDVRSLDYNWEPIPGIKADVSDDIEQAIAFFDSPDKRQPFRTWLAEWLQDVLRFDAGALYIRRDEAGDPLALEVISGTTIIPLVDFYGRRPEDESDTEDPEGLFEGEIVPAYTQIIEGMPWDWLAADDLIYQPWNPLPESQYGLAPLEAVLLSANTDIRFQWHFLQFFCYDDQTEILTRDGWRLFSEIDGSEEFATRSADGQFEWQCTKDQTVHRFDYDGELVGFKSQHVDQMVTPNHRMLVRRIPDKPGITSHTEAHDWHIRRADYFLENPTAEFQIPLTSTWDGVECEPNPPCGMTASQWAAFLGLYVAEGWCRQRSPDGKHRWEVIVAQWPGGKLDRADAILRGTGLNWHYDSKRGKYTVGCKEMWQALEAIPCGAPNKRLPDEVLDWTPTLVMDLLDGLLIGDGHTTQSGRRCYTTTSPTLADQVQVLWQRVGIHAWVRAGEQHPTSMGKRPIYVVRELSEDAFRVPKPKLVPYKGLVSCVSVPNGIVYVRRNGKPAWSGNTEGTVPAGFMEAPPDMSDPAQIAQWQETWDAVMQDDQSKLHQIRWVPSGSKFTEAKPSASKFDETFPLYLMRRTCAAFGITPADLGFTENVNKSSGDSQIDVQFRVGTRPLLSYVEDIINLFTKQYLKLRCQIRFDNGQETEDRVAAAQAAGIYLDHGVIGVDEVRAELGHPIDKTKPTARYINNTRSGPIPLIALDSMAGKIDAETYGPSADQKLVETPFATVAGVLPPQGSAEQKTAAETTAQAARDLREATIGKKQPEGEEPPPEEPAPVAAPEEEEPAQKQVAWQDVIELLDEIEKGADNTGVHPTAGITAETGIQGNPLDDEDDEDEDDEAVKSAYVALSLRRWRENSRNRLRKGRPPRKFVDEHLPAELHDEIWAKLGKAGTREEVDAAFAKSPKAPAASRAAFHSQADRIVEHYSPLIAKALSDMFSSQVVDDAIKAAQTAPVEKSAGPPPNLRDSETSLKRCINCCLFAHPVCVRFGDWPVKPDETCDGWELALDDHAEKSAASDAAKAAAVKVLQAAAAKLSQLKTVLQSLHGDSFLQGAHDAAAAAGGDVPESLVKLSTAAPESYWNTWEPGRGDAAAQAADGGMRDLLDQADITIKDMSDTSIDRIGNLISEGLAKGDNVQSVGQSIREVAEDPARSELIANTELCRASTAASVETYRQNEVAQVEWLAESDACEACEANADGSPYGLDDAPTPPEHPACRCALSPIVDIGTPETGDENSG